VLARLGEADASDALGPIVDPFARDAVRWPLAVATLYAEAAARVLDATRPRAVVITSDRRFPERALALAARARGIPSVLFWAGALLGRDRINLFDVGDRVAVIGEHARAALVAQGVDPARIAILGDPRSNAARLVSGATLRAQVFRELGLAGDRPLVVLVSKYVSVLFSAEEKEALYRTVHEAVGRVGSPHVVVKVHPNENVELLRAQVRAWGWPDAILTQDYDIHRLFGAAAAAVMVTSMAGIEAMAMGCPVVAVQTAGKDFEGASMPPYVTARAVERVDIGDAAALAATLRTLLHDEAARAALVARGRTFSARYIQTVDGALAGRLLDLVNHLPQATARR
jgi:glycosyltransferase involved in cell wall biosynthesis